MPTAFTVEGAPLFDEVLTPSVFPNGVPIQRPYLDTAITTTTVEVISLRPPQYGIPLSQRTLLLRQLLPNNGANRHVGLFRTLPSRAGVGGSECSGSGYARITHNTWRDVIVGGFVARRANSGEILFTELTGDLISVGWGIWDDDDVLRCFGPHRNEDGSIRIWEMGNTDQPRFGDGSLQVGIQ